jgi:hypothetical protein
MYVFHAREHQLGDVRKLIEAHGMTGVEVHAPFLGKSVIRCADAKSADLLQSSVEGLRAAA